MKHFYILILALFSVNIIFSQQENGVVSFDLPVNNSLKFNKFIINPAFSFVREEKSTIALFNRRQWTGFDNVPQTLFGSYSGKIGENNGVALGAFQQTYGVLTTTGAVVNYARNISFDEESNLTFGLNTAIFKSGIDAGRVITNKPDAILNNFPSNTLLSVSPGINYGTSFLDFGLTAKNIVFYNFATSKTLADDPAKSIDGHIMYTGFLENNGILEEGKFSAIARVEARKDVTILATIAMLNAPKFGWLQAGYNSVYGVSAGAGFNIAQNFSLGVTYEKALGNIVDRGSALEFVLSYHFTKSEDTNYVSPKNTVTYAPKNTATVISPSEIAKTKAEIELQKQKADELAKAKAKELADAKAKSEADKIKATQEAKQKADELAKAKAKELADAKAKSDANKANDNQSAKQKADELAKAKAKELADAKKLADDAAKTKAKELADAKKLADDAAKTKAKELADAKKLADDAAKAKAKELADAKAIADADKAKLAQEFKQKADELAKAKAKELAEAKKLADDAAKAKAKELADVKAIADTDKAKLAQEAKQKADELAKAKAKELADAKKLADDAAKAKAKELADAKAIADADKAKLAQEAKQKADELAKAKAKELADAKKLADDAAKAKAKELADAKKLADDAAKAKAKELADAKKLADDAAKAKAKELADAKKLADDAAKAKAKEVADAKAIADADKAKLAQEAKQKADELAKAKAKELADAKKLADDAAKAKAKEIADAKAIADADKAKLAQEAKQKADELAKAKAKELADAKAKADEIANAKAKAIADAEAAKLKKDLEDAKIAASKDENDRSMDYLKQVQEENNAALALSLKKLDSLAKSRQTDLNDLKEENDTGIIKPEKPFQSASIARKALQDLKNELEEGTKSQKEFINQSENLLKARLVKYPNRSDAVNLGYQKSIDNLKADVLKLEQATNAIDAKIEKINADIEVEKKRRIKKANFENPQVRFEKDRAALKAIKESTKPISGDSKPSDFDFGDDENNMQILKKVDNTTTGFYIVLAVHKDIAKRDAFVARVVAAGERNVDYFYNVSSGKYFIYVDKADYLSDAQRILDKKDNKGYNTKRFIIKIEN